MAHMARGPARANSICVWSVGMVGASEFSVLSVGAVCVLVGGVGGASV
jgi:hypothetical protein